MYTTIIIYGVGDSPTEELQTLNGDIERVIELIDELNGKLMCIIPYGLVKDPHSIIVHVNLIAGRFSTGEVTEKIVSRLGALLQPFGKAIQVEITLLHPAVSVFEIPAPVKINPPTS